MPALQGSSDILKIPEGPHLHLPEHLRIRVHVRGAGGHNLRQSDAHGTVPEHGGDHGCHGGPQLRHSHCTGHPGGQDPEPLKGERSVTVATTVIT